MTERAEIERLLNQTGRTLEELPYHYSVGECIDAIKRIPFKSSSEMPFETGNMLCHQSDVIELLVGALRDALDMHPKWISVKDKLPDTHEDGSVDAVLVTDGCVMHMAYFIDGAWVYCECGEMKEPMFYDVTHWMPLPEPPKEE